MNDLPTANGQDFAKWNPPLFYVPNKQIEDIIALYGYFEASGGSVHVGNEVKRNYFIHLLLSIIGSSFTKSVLLKTEGALDSTVYAFQAMLIFIVEAKQELHIKGFGLLMVLYAGFNMNLGLKFKIPVRGALTTADKWQFVNFVRPYSKIEVSKEFNLPEVTDEAGIRNIAGIYYALLAEGWISALKAFVEMVKYEFEEITKGTHQGTDEFRDLFQKLIKDMEHALIEAQFNIQLLRNAKDDTAASHGAQEIKKCLV